MHAEQSQLSQDHFSPKSEKLCPMKETARQTCTAQSKHQQSDNIRHIKVKQKMK